MRIFQDIYETGKRSFISAFSICMTVPLTAKPVLDIFLQILRIFQITAVF